MKAYLTIALIALSVYNAEAQSKSDSIAGEYYLTGVREMASGFWLKSDSSFEFFFSYGALDRAGKGRWRLNDARQIILTSGPRPAADFALTGSSTKKDYKGVMFIIVHNNPLVLATTIFRLQTASGEVDQKTNSHGEAMFPAGNYDKVQVLFELCPDRFTTIQLPKGNFNEFSFRMEDWITEVFFDQFRLNVKDGQLTGPHPLMDGKEFVYQRNNSQ